jgi:hypothetical protein
MALHIVAQSRTCAIKSLIGSVKIRRGEASVWTDAKLRMQLREKDAIRTFLESEVELETSEGSIIKIGENSSIEMAKFQEQGAVQSTKVKMLNGTMLSNIKKLVDTRSGFDFETPTALASIRGTVISLDVTAERTNIKVYEGRVLVIPSGAQKGAELTDNQMTSIAKGQSTVAIQKLEEKPPTGIIDSVKKSNDSLSTTPADSIRKADTAQQGLIQPVDSGAKKVLRMTIATPANGQTFSKPLIPISGTATVGSEVTITPPGVRITILTNGSFSTQAPIPDEDGEYIIEIEGILNGVAQKIIRKVVYHPEFRFVVTTPQNRQIVSTTIFPVKGEVHPVKGAEVSVLGRKMAITADGDFTGMVSIPDEEGEVQLDFEVSAGGITQTISRSIVYKRAVDTYSPLIQGILPKFAKQRRLCLPVYDRTPGDEVTFYFETDGARQEQTGSGSGSYCFDLELGIHDYAIWAEDKAHNKSQRLTGKIAYLESSAWYIKVRKPAGEETIRMPPSPPDDLFEPTYIVDFSIENLPGDDMRLIREVRVINQTTGKGPNPQSVFTDQYLEFEVQLKPGKSNVIAIEVQDCNGNKKVQQAVIHLK